MNIARVISDVLRGNPPRPRARQSGGLDNSPVEEFLERDVWSLLKETRQALESEGLTGIAVRPPPGDLSRTHALLILDPCESPGEGCALRFVVLNNLLCARVRHPERNDEMPFVLDPQGSMILVRSVLEEFLSHCLAPIATKRRNGQCHAKPRSQPEAKPRLQVA